MTPSLCPGQFSTSVVIISCPPASRPSMTSGLRLARAAYSAAVSPAGPDPIMTTLRNRDMSEARRRSDVLVDELLQFGFVGEPDDLFDQLSALEQEQRGD